MSERSYHKPFNHGAFQKNQCMFRLFKKKMGNPHMLCFPTPLNMVVNSFPNAIDFVVGVHKFYIKHSK